MSGHGTADDPTKYVLSEKPAVVVGTGLDVEPVVFLEWQFYQRPSLSAASIGARRTCFSGGAVLFIGSGIDALDKAWPESVSTPP